MNEDLTLVLDNLCPETDYDEVTHETFYCLLELEHEGPCSGYWEQTD